MIAFEYDKRGDAVSDFELEAKYLFILRFHRLPGTVIQRYTTSNIYYRVLAGLAEGDLDEGDVLFLFNGQEIVPNKYGAIGSWPHGFLGVEGNLATRILSAAMKKKRMENTR